MKTLLMLLLLTVNISSELPVFSGVDWLKNHTDQFKMASASQKCQADMTAWGFGGNTPNVSTNVCIGACDIYRPPYDISMDAYFFFRYSCCSYCHNECNQTSGQNYSCIWYGNLTTSSQYDTGFDCKCAKKGCHSNKSYHDMFQDYKAKCLSPPQPPPTTTTLPVSSGIQWLRNNTDKFKMAIASQKCQNDMTAWGFQENTPADTNNVCDGTGDIYRPPYSLSLDAYFFFRYSCCSYCHNVCNQTSGQNYSCLWFGNLTVVSQYDTGFNCQCAKKGCHSKKSYYDMFLDYQMKCL